MLLDRNFLLIYFANRFGRRSTDNFWRRIGMLRNLFCWL